ncbi:MAG: preprotein translocase subunit SecE [Pirellulaceae bacterium]|nr:preprotein translocase subunit SecE [Pirellulaceae bacterium]
MANPSNKQSTAGYFASFFSLSLHKPKQGMVVRQVTFAVFAIIVLFASYRLYYYEPIVGEGNGKIFIPIGFLLAGLWATFRLVYYPRFADFLISVEAEMNKVSWPSKPEIVRSSLVVIVTMLILTAALFSFDTAWHLLFDLLGVGYQQNPS